MYLNSILNIFFDYCCHSETNRLIKNKTLMKSKDEIESQICRDLRQVLNDWRRLAELETKVGRLVQYHNEHYANCNTEQRVVYNI